VGLNQNEILYQFFGIIEKKTKKVQEKLEIVVTLFNIFYFLAKIPLDQDPESGSVSGSALR